MIYKRYAGRTHFYIGLLHLEIMKRHINYSWKFRDEYYHLTVPFNIFNRRGYGMYISPDGTPHSARYYRPKREWGLVEPNDPGYYAALEAEQPNPLEEKK